MVPMAMIIQADTAEPSSLTVPVPIPTHGSELTVRFIRLGNVT